MGKIGATGRPHRTGTNPDCVCRAVLFPRGRSQPAVSLQRVAGAEAARRVEESLVMHRFRPSLTAGRDWLSEWPTGDAC
jgi:hypothetical protein